MRHVDGKWHHKARVLDKACMSDDTDCVKPYNNVLKIK